MQLDFVENVNDISKASYEAIQSLGDINSKTLQKLIDIQFGLTAYGMESSVEQFKLLSETNSYSELMASGSDLASEYNGKMMEYTRQTADVLTNSREEMSDWVQASMKLMSEVAEVKEAPVAKKPAARKTSKKTTKRAKKA